MGVNGQKRKKKQGPVPTLEESLPKKLKREKAIKEKKNKDGLGKRPSSKSPSQKVDEPKVNVEALEDETRGDAEDNQAFEATKAFLFDDDEEEQDKFDALEIENSMYVSTIETALNSQG
jgi:hypothetical protein